MNVPAEADRIGATVGGKYRVVRLLARGGMGVVYEAQHAVVRRRFAIKFLRRDLAERRDILGRFQREAEAAGALENDNVAAAVDFGITDDGAPFIVMEYLVGESLADLLERVGRLPVHRAADLVAQASRGVEAAHAAGIVHRDLKPQNLFVARRDDGTDLVKVLDFGVAKLQAIDEATAATGTGMVLGTAAYMSPEQARGEKTIDKRTDVYALGAILYELVSQKKPHPGESPNAILHHIATHPAVPLGSVRADLPVELVAIVGRALASEPAARPASAGDLAQELAAIARREVWPPPPELSAPTVSALASTALAATPEGKRPASTSGDRHRTASAPPAGASRGKRAALGITAVVAVAAIAVGIGLKTRSGAPRPDARRPSPLAEGTKFFVPPTRPAAAEQITRLATAGALRDASLLTAVQATPRAAYFDGGTPAEVEAAVRKIVMRAANLGEVPVLAAYNLPFRDCSQYAAGGARDGAAYRAWIEGFVRGIGNDQAVVILEPDGLGIIPNNTALDGSADWCKPTVTGSDGKPVPAPGATADERYALIGAAVDRFASDAPRAIVYLDATHGAWLSVGEIAYRLAKAHVDRTGGFAVNVNNFHATAQEVKYGTWISKCLLYAAHGGGAPARFKECASQYVAGQTGVRDWVSPARWYAENVDRAPWASSPEAAPTHFVVDTGRSGRGSLDVAVYGRPPFNQPQAVLEKLKAGDWCNSPSAGIGVRPTARTGVPLVDAYLWIKTPGESDGSCDIAGGARAWDFSKFNPWGISGEPQRHFDPLWGMVVPSPGEWFPDAAVQLARNADPPLAEEAPGRVVEKAPEKVAGRPSLETAPVGGQKVAAAESDPGAAAAPGRPAGRPGERSARRPERAAPATGAPAAATGPPPGPKIPTSLPPTFDPANPYR